MSESGSPAPEGSPRQNARSPTPEPEEGRGRSQSRSPSRSPARSASPERKASGSPEKRDRSRTPENGVRSKSPEERGRSRTPDRRGRSRTPDKRERSRTRSPAANGDYRGRAENPGTNLYVTGLSTRVTEEDLEKLFSKEGKVSEARIVRDPRTRESRGFGFITMATSSEADTAIRRIDGTAFEGRRLTVEKAKRARERTPTPGQYRGVRGPHEAPPRSSRYESDRYDRGRSERYDRYSDRGYDRYDDRYDRRRRSPDYGYSRRERSPYDRDRGYYRR